MFLQLRQSQDQFPQVNLSIIPSSLTGSTLASSSNLWIIPGPVSKSIIPYAKIKVRCWSTDGRNCQRKLVNMQMSRCFQSEGFQFSALLHSAQRLLPAPSLQTPARHSPSLAHSQTPWPQHQMQVPGCAGGCCFRFLSAPSFSLYSTGRC